MKPIRFCILLIFVLCAVIVGLTIMYFSMKRRRTYWKNKAIAEARKRLTRDDEREAEHNAEIRRLSDLLRKYREKVAELERKNNVLRQLNEQLRRGNQKKEETTCP